MDELVREFIAETVESLAELDLDLVRLEKEPGNHDLIGNIFRLMHTIKGTCGFIGLPRLEKTAHAAENLLDNFRNGTKDVNEKSMTLLFMCIDRVRFLVGQVSEHGREPEGDDSDIVCRIESDIENPAEASVPTAAAPPIVEDVVKIETGEKNPDYLRVQMNVLEDLINMVSELVLTRNQLLQLVRMEESSALKAPLQRLNRIVSDLQDNVMKTRMQPIGNAWSKLPRIVRDLSTETRKKIVLEMEGEDTELDRQVLESIKDPLTHMVRNSCDHGIEVPEERQRKGKREQGTIRLKAYHEGGFIILKISDDGKGLDAQKIAAKAVENGIVDADKISSLSEKQILSFIMRPGFSTADKVTNISGRGVGMDVVRANIEKIGGSIDMESVPGKGTSFTIQIPLTLAIISALIVEIDHHRYALPQMNIQELVSLNHGDDGRVEYINDKPVLRLRERIIPLLDSAALFNLPQASAVISGDNKLIAVVSTGSSYYGIILDRIYDIEEVVIKSVSSVLRQANIFAGNTILGDGQVIMILDPAAIARKFNVERAISQLEGVDSTRAIAARQKETASMLVFKVGDGALKAIPLALISRIHIFAPDAITHSADKMVVRFDDHLMQLFFIESQSQSIGAGDVTTLILSDDRSAASMGLIIDQVIDIVEDALDLTTSTMRPGILGSMILNNHTVDVIDIAYFIGLNAADWFSTQSHNVVPYVHHHLRRMRDDHPVPIEPQRVEVANDRAGLFGEHHVGSRRPRLLLVDDSPFFRSMLYPVLTGAGYDVTLMDDAINAIKLHDEGRMFDIILSDIEMPGMDGYEFVEKMREQSAWKETPFIAITSHNTKEDIEYGYKKGFNKYIGKFDKEELIRSLDSVRA